MAPLERRIRALAGRTRRSDRSRTACGAAHREEYTELRGVFGSVRRPRAIIPASSRRVRPPAWMPSGSTSTQDRVGSGRPRAAGRSSSPTLPAPERRSAAGGPVFWLPDQPILRAFPVPSRRLPFSASLAGWLACGLERLRDVFGPVARCADRPRLQRRARAGFSPASRRTKMRRILVPPLPLVRLAPERGDTLHRRWSPPG